MSAPIGGTPTAFPPPADLIACLRRVCLEYEVSEDDGHPAFWQYSGALVRAIKTAEEALTAHDLAESQRAEQAPVECAGKSLGQVLWHEAFGDEPGTCPVHAGKR